MLIIPLVTAFSRLRIFEYGSGTNHSGRGDCVVGP